MLVCSVTVTLFINKQTPLVTQGAIVTVLHLTCASWLRCALFLHG